MIFVMLYYFDINTCIVTTVSSVSNTLTRRATLRLQLVSYILDDFLNIYFCFFFVFQSNSHSNYIAREFGTQTN